MGMWSSKRFHEKQTELKMIKWKAKDSECNSNVTGSTWFIWICGYSHKTNTTYHKNIIGKYKTNGYGEHANYQWIRFNPTNGQVEISSESNGRCIWARGVFDGRELNVLKLDDDEKLTARLFNDTLQLEWGWNYYTHNYSMSW